MGWEAAGWGWGFPGNPVLGVVWIPAPCRVPALCHVPTLSQVPVPCWVHTPSPGAWAHQRWGAAQPHTHSESPHPPLGETEAWAASAFGVWCPVVRVAPGHLAATHSPAKGLGSRGKDGARCTGSCVAPNSAQLLMSLQCLALLHSAPPQPAPQHSPGPRAAVSGTETQPLFLQLTNSKSPQCEAPGQSWLSPAGHDCTQQPPLGSWGINTALRAVPRSSQHPSAAVPAKRPVALRIRRWAAARPQASCPLNCPAQGWQSCCRTWAMRPGAAGVQGWGQPRISAGPRRWAWWKSSRANTGSTYGTRSCREDGVHAWHRGSPSPH